MALAIVVIAASIGTLLGLLSGYCRRLGRPAGDALHRHLLLAAGRSSSRWRWRVALAGASCRWWPALSLIWWPTYARLVRGMVLSNQGATARAGGPGPWAPAARGILRRHVLPFVQQSLLVRATQDVGYALVAVASLSFIGVGAQPPTPEWGLILAGAPRQRGPPRGPTWSSPDW